MNHGASFSPIVLFAFNRPDLFEQTLKSLSECDGASETEAFVFVDGPRHSDDRVGVLNCEALAMEYVSCFKRLTVEVQSRNYGLASSLRTGITKVFERSQSLIVVEDDLVVSKDFLRFMNLQLNYYQDEKRVGSVSGFGIKLASKDNSPFNYFHTRPCSWGWGTWVDRWNRAIWEVDGDCLKPGKGWVGKFNAGGQDLTRMLNNQLKGSINSWAILWAYTHFRNNWLASYPKQTFVMNNGFGEASTHCKGPNPFPSEWVDGSILNDLRLEDDIEVNPKIVSQVNYYHSNLYKAWLKLSSFWRT